jgi:hypothetical protein
MANLIPLAIADLELQLGSSITVGDESFTISSAVDDDGEALPAGKYCFTVDSGTSNKEYLIGQLNGVNVTSVKSVSRQGVETTGAVRAHRVGNPCIVTNFATIQRVADILRGVLTLDGTSPIVYDAEPTLSSREELATVGYVLDTATGGTVAFDAQTTAGNAGETITAGAYVYFKTSDQEWYLADASVAAEVENVAMGFALGAGTDGVGISGGIQISGTFTTTGLTAGSTYYATDTAGTISTTAGTTNRVVGVALSTTKLLMVPVNPESLTSDERVFVSNLENGNLLPRTEIFTSSGTWTKDAGLKYITVEVQAAGGGGAGGEDSTAGSDSGGGGGASGGYSKKMILASSLGSTETVTVGSAGSGGTVTAAGSDGGDSSFGSHVTTTGGEGGIRGINSINAGGTASGGDVNINGVSGDTPYNIGGEDPGAGGRGANSVLGLGGHTVSNATAQPGTGYGAGGAGGEVNGAEGEAGGAGAPGIVIVTEYYS